MTDVSRRTALSRRRFLTSTATAVVTGALVSACDGGSTKAVVPKGVEGVPKATPDALVPGVQYKTGYVGPRARVKKPFGDPGTTFRIVVPQDTQTTGDWNKNSFSQWLEARTGVKVRYDTVVVADGDMTKVNAMIAAGDLPDAFLGIPFTPDQISLYGGQGIFVAQDDYIDTYAVEIKEAIAKFPELRRLGLASDGKTYAFPRMSDCYHCRIGAGRTYVSQSLVKAVGAELPRTTDEFRALLKAFKDQDANGHGNVVPLLAGVDSPLDVYFMNSFLYNPGEPWLRLDQGKVDFVAGKDEWREGLRFLRSLFDDGTLTSEVFSMTNETRLRLGNNPGYQRVGVARAFHWGVFLDIAQERWRDYVALPPLKGPNGVGYAAWDYYQFYQPGLIITDQCADPGALVRWADHQVELETWMNGYAGPRGKTWDFAKPGAKGLLGQQATYKITKAPPPVGLAWGTSWGAPNMKYATDDWRMAEESNPATTNYEAALYQVTKQAYEPSRQPMDQQLPPLVFAESDAATNANTKTTIVQHVKSALADFTVGKLDVDDDRTWDKYVEALDKMGLPGYLESHQRAYDKYRTNG
ncbi:hypothetical protein [Kribbella italica]|uniref:Putative aldouronate transport system substrate-binding protein n=1 Tax=Kribbella italica TaxID=1540520 RepID=A0A7W9J532_9ACTN|nr:hypothetical protein [Kribbella italica]MBB5835792.1 putative aldouronate transport system substrate-binding protein [Kribbella italica]